MKMPPPNKIISISDLSNALNEEIFSTGTATPNQFRESRPPSQIFSFQTIDSPTTSQLPDFSHLITSPQANQHQNSSHLDKIYLFQATGPKPTDQKRHSTVCIEKIPSQITASLAANRNQDSIPPAQKPPSQTAALLAAGRNRESIVPLQNRPSQDKYVLAANQTTTIPVQMIPSQSQDPLAANQNRNSTVPAQNKAPQKRRNSSSNQTEPVFKTARSTFKESSFIERKNHHHSTQYRPSGTHRREKPNGVGNCFYVKTIECTSFVFWLISRVFKHKIWIFLLIPFMAYLFKGMLSTEASSRIQLNLSALFSKIGDTLPKTFTYGVNISIENFPEELSCTEKLLFILQFLWFTVFNFIANVSNKAYTSLSKVPVVSKTSHLIETSVRQFLIANILPKRDELKSIASEIVDEKFMSILKKLKAAHLKYDMIDENLSNISELEKLSLNKLDDWLQFKLADYKNQSFLELSRLFKQIDTEHEQEKNIENTVERVVRRYLETNSNISRKNYSSPSDTCSSNFIRKLVKEALLVYDADKTGRVDYALESAGGSIVSTRCSESYLEKGNQYSLFGISLSTDAYTSPRKAIQPSMQPGQCWAFKGSQGFLVIKLAYTIHPTGFSMEHIPVSLSPSGSIDSAPKNFSVWGLKSENDKNGKMLGTYVYSLKGNPLQYFTVQNPSDEAFPLIELKIHSNHGNPEYTCLYRFRVHGERENGKKKELGIPKLP